MKQGCVCACFGRFDTVCGSQGGPQMTRMWQVWLRSGVTFPPKAGLTWRVAGLTRRVEVEGEGRFDVACIAFPFRLLGGAVGSDVTPGQLIRKWETAGPFPSEWT